MDKKEKRVKGKSSVEARVSASFKQMHLDAAGIDVGATEHYVPFQLTGMTNLYGVKNWVIDKVDELTEKQAV